MAREIDAELEWARALVAWIDAMRPCSQSGCDAKAVVICHWVTGPLDCCRPHAAMWLAIADCLGMHMPVVPIVYPPPPVHPSAKPDRLGLLEVD